MNMMSFVKKYLFEYTGLVLSALKHCIFSLTLTPEFDRMPDNLNDNERKTHDKGKPGGIRGRKVTGSLQTTAKTQMPGRLTGKNL